MTARASQTRCPSRQTRPGFTHDKAIARQPRKRETSKDRSLLKGQRMTVKRSGAMASLTVLMGCAFQACAQDQKPDPVSQETIQYEQIDGALIYDHDPSTRLGDDVFGTIISDLEHDFPGRNSHGGPVCMEYPNGQIVAFNTNTSDHNNDGWSEYAVSRDGGKNWEKLGKVQQVPVFP